MKKLLLGSITLAITWTGTADAEPVSRNHARDYERAYRAVALTLGPRAPGRNIVRDGTARGAVTDTEVTDSIRVLNRLVSQASRGASGPASSAGTAASTTAVAPASTSSSLPSCTWAAESGGNPSALNPESGAGGYYQILPSTWAAYGGSGSPQDAPMSEQTRIAERIWDSQGSGAWANC